MEGQTHKAGWSNVLVWQLGTGRSIPTAEVLPEEQAAPALSGPPSPECHCWEAASPQHLAVGIGGLGPGEQGGLVKPRHSLHGPEHRLSLKNTLMLRSREGAAAQKVPGTYGGKLNSLAAGGGLEGSSLQDWRVSRHRWPWLSLPHVAANTSRHHIQVSTNLASTVLTPRWFFSETLPHPITDGVNFLCSCSSQELTLPMLQSFLKSLKCPQTPNQWKLASGCLYFFLSGPMTNTSGGWSQFTE